MLQDIKVHSAVMMLSKHTHTQAKERYAQMSLRSQRVWFSDGTLCQKLCSKEGMRETEELEIKPYNGLWA